MVEYVHDITHADWFVWVDLAFHLWLIGHVVNHIRCSCLTLWRRFRKRRNRNNPTTPRPAGHLRLSPGWTTDPEHWMPK